MMPASDVRADLHRRPCLIHWWQGTAAEVIDRIVGKHLKRW